MGADHIEFIPSEPINGVKRFFTTNGKAFFNEADSSFYFYDSTVIIRVNSESWTASNFSNLDGTLSVREENLRLEFFPESGGCDVQIQPLAEVKWEDGLGEASEGVFPSAWGPFVDQQKVLR